MGNQTSSQNNTETKDELKPKSISQILDYIATYYILTMDFKSLKRLYDKEYCDKLVILTSDIIQRYFTEIEITYLAQRVKNGVEVNEIDKDKVIFFNRDRLDKLDVQNSVKKKRICLGIAKFYIKIAHIFAAIVTTINPVYVYRDAEGNKVKATLSEKSKIPTNTPREIYKLNICDNRINALKNNNSLESDSNGEIYVGPKVCNMNINTDGQNKSLTDEPGIPELVELYYDDNYDYNSGKFTGMSEKTKKVFQEDLKIFYNVFTGNKDIKPEITKFSDIKLRDYHNMPICKGPDAKFNKKHKGKLSNKLFSDYAENLKQMMSKANNNQNALLTIINQIFVYTIDPQTGKKQIRIVPTLSEERLQELVVETRALIIKLYLTCEMDYVNGLKLYEAIVEKKIYETAQSQIDNLKKMEDKLMTDEKIPEPAETAVINEAAKEKLEKIEEKAEEEKKVVEEKTENVLENINNPNPNPPNQNPNPPNPPNQNPNPPNPPNQNPNPPNQNPNPPNPPNQNPNPNPSNQNPNIT
jgi:hypothetical protein